MGRGLDSFQRDSQVIIRGELIREGTPILVPCGENPYFFLSQQAASKLSLPAYGIGSKPVLDIKYLGRCSALKKFFEENGNTFAFPKLYFQKSKRGIPMNLDREFYTGDEVVPILFNFIRDRKVPLERLGMAPRKI